VRPPVNGRCRLVPAGAIADISSCCRATNWCAARKTPARPPDARSAPNLGCSPIADVDLKDPQFERVKLASGADARTLSATRCRSDPAHGGGAGRPSRPPPSTWP